MRVVFAQGEIFEAKIANIFHLRVKPYPRQGAEIAAQLFPGLFEMILVQMQIAKRVDELARSEGADLRHHHGEQCIGSDVERDAEKKIGAALVKLTAQLVVADVKLEENMAGR